MPLPPTIYQDQSILVLNKPSGLIIELSHTHGQPTLEEALPDKPDLERKGIVHRLDRDTSGVMVVAQTPQAQAILQEQFKQRTVNKTYLALVWGRVGEEHGIIDAPIARHPVQGHKFVAMEEGRPAVTEFWCEQGYRFNNEPVTLLRLHPHTGRTHQIRVHLSALGFPIVGDPVYGRRKDKSNIRLFLHAKRLEFSHPETGERVAFEVPLPEDLQNFLQQLEK